MRCTYGSGVGSQHGSTAVYAGSIPAGASIRLLTAGSEVFPAYCRVPSSPDSFLYYGAPSGASGNMLDRRKGIFMSLEKYADLEPAWDAVIPSPVRYCDKLPPNAKLLYGEIRSLTRSRGYCWAGNDYFSDLYTVSERSIARWISQLAELSFIKVVITRDKEGHVDGRRIFISEKPNDTLNDALSNMTKKSAKLTKKSALPDNNVSQSLNNNINNKESTRAKKTDSSAALLELTAWAQELTDEPEELVASLTDFCASRDQRGNPIPPGRACTTLKNKLTRFATVDGVCYPALMVEMLDKAVFRNWDSVYTLKPDEIQSVLDGQTASVEVDDKWL